MNFPVKNYRVAEVPRAEITVDPVTKVDIRCDTRGKALAEKMTRNACPLGAGACGAEVVFNQSSSEHTIVICNTSNCPPEASGKFPPDGGDREPRNPVPPSSSGSMQAEPTKV